MENQLTPWLSVIGLGLDIIGVSILAIEVWRSTSGDEAFLSDFEKDSRVQLMGPAPIEEEHQEVNTKMLSPEVERAILILNEKIAMMEFSERAGAHIDWRTVAMASAKRKRFIALGTILLIVGFSIQIYAAWPQ